VKYVKFLKKPPNKRNKRREHVFKRGDVRSGHFVEEPA
jgi:hypothetical protein